MNNKSVLAGIISEPEKEQHEEPEIVRKGPHPKVPPANRNSPPSELLLDFIVNRWPKPAIRMRDILRLGPGSLRDRKSAMNTAKILAQNGWLKPLKTRQHNEKMWRIVRGPN
jgi:hypothetical protein